MKAALALHRSISFWAGLLVMGFVCWAWWDSKYHDSLFSWHGIMADNGGCGISLGYVTSSNGFTAYDPGLKLERSELVPPAKTCEAAQFLRGEGKDVADLLKLHPELEPDWENPSAGTPLQLDHIKDLKIWMEFQQSRDWLFFIPHWLILVAVTLVWCGLLVWRVRRRVAAFTRAEG